MAGNHRNCLPTPLKDSRLTTGFEKHPNLNVSFCSPILSLFKIKEARQESGNIQSLECSKNEPFQLLAVDRTVLFLPVGTGSHDSGRETKFLDLVKFLHDVTISK